MSDRLHHHGVRWRFRGFPIFDDEYPYEQIGVTTEDEWKWTDLTPDEQADLKAQADALVAESTRRTPDQPITLDFATGWVLSQHGVTCFHRWRYTNDPRGVPFMKDCAICMVSMPLPGSVHKVGDRWMRLSDPPPRTVSVVREADHPARYVNDPDPSPLGAALPIDEYRWNGRGYEPA